MTQLFADLPVVTAPPRQAPPPRPSRAKPKREATATFGTIITDPDRFRIDAQRKTRRCLSCGDDFNSHGPGNRICSPCKDLDGWKAAVTEFAIVSAAGF